MPELLHEDFDVKIISVRRQSVSEQTIIDLQPYLVYEDTNYSLMEDLYSIEDSEHENQELMELRKLCEENNAAYFRLVNI